MSVLLARLPIKSLRALPAQGPSPIMGRDDHSPEREAAAMGINTERDIEANLQIGPTDQGMVRVFIEADGVEIPMDFEPEEAEEIADEIRAAAMAARAVTE